MKKIVSILLCVFLLLPLLAAGASAKELPFNDVDSKAWYYGAISECYHKGIMKGTSTSKFAPGKTMTRAMFAQALANYSSNFKAPDIEQQFPDVKKDAWYYDAMQWMASLQIITGTGSGNATPDRAITRAEAAVMLYRYSLLCKTNYKYGEGTDITLYDDFEQIPQYAWGSVTWANTNGIMLGTTKDLFSPNKHLTRAQAAMVLTRISGMNNPTYETYEYLVKWNDTEIAMDLPISWKTECLFETQEEPGKSGRLITFINKSNHTIEIEGMMYGGKLFWFDVLPADAPAPPNNSRGFYAITQDGVDYMVYICRPTDVQFEDDPNGYMLMYEQIDNIMKSVRPSWV